MKKLICSLLAAVVLLLVINEYTSFFSDFGSYAPALEKNFPDAVEAVEQASDYASDFTDFLPTPAELIAIIKNEPMPIDPEDVAVNAYIEDSPMLTFYPKENISAKIKDGEYIRLFGVSHDDERQHFVVRFSDGENDEIDQTTMSVDSSGEFDKLIKIPKTNKKRLSVEVYAGSNAVGSFTSWVYNYLYLTKDENGAWSISRSPVYAHNKKLYETNRAISEALKSTPSIESDKSDIKELAKRITANAEKDYDKIRKIHDWVCSNIVYDTDKLRSSSTVPYAAGKVLESKSAVCLGFSTLTAALCRSVGIPCNVVSGYALGVGEDTEWSVETINTEEQNHAWNEAYVDGRWVIMDTTWDCPNKIENGERITGEVSHIYFDANIDFFSTNHKIIEYMRRP